MNSENILEKITEAMYAVESCGADIILTDAIVLLSSAKQKIQEYQEKNPDEARPNDIQCPVCGGDNVAGYESYSGFLKICKNGLCSHRFSPNEARLQSLIAIYEAALTKIKEAGEKYKSDTEMAPKSSFRSGVIQAFECTYSIATDALKEVRGK